MISPKAQPNLEIGACPFHFFNYVDIISGLGSFKSSECWDLGILEYHSILALFLYSFFQPSSKADHLARWSFGLGQQGHSFVFCTFKFYIHLSQKVIAEPTLPSSSSSKIRPESESFTTAPIGTLNSLFGCVSSHTWSPWGEEQLSSSTVTHLCHVAHRYTSLNVFCDFISLAVFNWISSYCLQAVQSEFYSQLHSWPGTWLGTSHQVKGNEAAPFTRTATTQVHYLPETGGRHIESQ